MVMVGTGGTGAFVNGQQCSCPSGGVVMDHYDNIGIPGYALYYFRRPEVQYKIGHPNPNVTMAVIVSHGAARNAEDYFCYMQNSVDSYFGANRDAVLVFAPWFAGPEDNPAPNQIYWASDGGWKWCDLSTKNITKRTSSCTMLDSVAQNLADRNIYPSLKTIVLTGHSAGGQIAQRYALGTPVTEMLQAKGLTLRYVPNNPSTYAYLDNSRPYPDPISPNCSNYCIAQEIPTIQWTFKPTIDTQLFSCVGTYNDWGYGLEKKNNYMSQTSNPNMIQRYPSRTVIYGLGAADVCNSMFGCGCDDEDLDASCPADAQGWCRFARGYAWFNYLNWFYKVPVHAMAVCPGVSHDGCAMLQCPQIQAAIFTGQSTTQGA